MVGNSLEGMEALADAFVAKSPFRDFDLSRNKSIRVLEITASTILHRTPGFLTRVFSTIPYSPAPLEVVIIYRDYNLCVGIPPRGGDGYIYVFEPGQKETSWHRRLFGVFREMHKTRNIRLVLCVDVWDRVGEHAVRVLEQAVAAEKARRGFGDVFPEPLVIYSPRRSRRDGFTEEGFANTLSPWFPLWKLYNA